MNANELADLIGMCGDGGYNQDAATMLRQQQAEIEALKQIIDANNLNQNIGQFVKTANKPVAWMQEFECSKTGQKRRRLEFEQIGIDDIPLYTHPVKELTDEEIKELSEKHLDMDWQTGVIEFARAILRKAQEK